MTTFDEANAFNRAYAQSVGVDPNLVTGLTIAEGGVGIFNGSYSHYDPTPSGSPGTSYGQFQLRLPGVGQDAQNAGINVTDPSNWQAANKYAIDYIAANGTGKWTTATKYGVDGLIAKGAVPVEPPAARRPEAVPAGALTVKASDYPEALRQRRSQV